jgi:hypothetical protein
MAFAGEVMLLAAAILHAVAGLPAVAVAVAV